MIGITTTVPVEIIFAARLRPVDLNNLFITSQQPERLVDQAESAGFSHSLCSWVKGIYATVIEYDIKEVVIVTGGDCSNSIALGELLSRRGVKTILFEFPFNRDRALLKDQMDGLRRSLSTTWPEIEATKEKVDAIRCKLKRLDKLTYQENVVTGFENHTFLVNSSDFNGDLDGFDKKLDRFLISAESRPPLLPEIRLGYLGVPPIFSQFYELIESLGARVVFNEVQRQFSMPFFDKGLVDQYLEYTYPYDFGARLKDIEQAIDERGLDGLIHYTQTFCHRQIYDIMLRESLDLPILTLEGDRPGRVDSRTVFRIETFVEMLRGRK